MFGLGHDNGVLRFALSKAQGYWGDVETSYGSGNGKGVCERIAIPCARQEKTKQKEVFT